MSDRKLPNEVEDALRRFEVEAVDDFFQTCPEYPAVCAALRSAILSALDWAADEAARGQADSDMRHAAALDASLNARLRAAEARAAEAREALRELMALESGSFVYTPEFHKWVRDVKARARAVLAVADEGTPTMSDLTDRKLPNEVEEAINEVALALNTALMGQFEDSDLTALRSAFLAALDQADEERSTAVAEAAEATFRARAAETALSRVENCDAPGPGCDCRRCLRERHHEHFLRAERAEARSSALAEGLRGLCEEYERIAPAGYEAEGKCAARLRALLDVGGSELDEDVARLINGLIEAGDLLLQHVQRIDFDPGAANLARECWLESRAKCSGDEGPKHWPGDALPPICKVHGIAHCSSCHT